MMMSQGILEVSRDLHSPACDNSLRCLHGQKPSALAANGVITGNVDSHYLDDPKNTSRFSSTHQAGSMRLRWYLAVSVE